MKSFTVEYNGRSIEFSQLHENGVPVGYAYHCPKCPQYIHAHSWIETGSGQNHRISFDDQGRATVVGSLLCRTPLADNSFCGWHVHITNGVARDC